MHVSAWPGLNPGHLLRGPSTGGQPFPLNAPARTFFYRARNAIYHLFRALGSETGDEVLVPAYHSGNEVAAIRAAGATPIFHPVSRRLEVDVDDLRRRWTPKTRAVFAIHYLGWPQPVAELAALCRERDALLVEDCALSLLSEAGGRALGMFGDHAVFCLYKTLPVPNGGVLVHNRAPLPALESLSLRSCGMAPLAGRSAELVLEWLRGRCNGPTQALFGLKRAAGRALRAAGVEPVPVGDMGFELSQVDVGISPMCEVLMRRWDCGAIRDRRRANYRHLRARLAGRVTPLLEDLPEGVCPLFFPILVGDKRGAARALRARGVEAIEFWNEGDAGARDFADTRFLRKHVLELPIHQDLSPEQIDYVADRVGELRPGLPC